MAYPIDKYVDEYSKQFTAKGKIIVDEINSLIKKGVRPDVAVEKAFAKHSVNSTLSKSLLNVILDSSELAVGVKVAASPLAFKNWYLENAVSADGSNFSSKTTKLMRADEIAGTLRISHKKNESFSTASQRLHDSGVLNGDVAQDVQATLKAARSAFAVTQDVDGYRAYRSKLLKTQRRIDTLKDPSTSKLKKAYQDVLDITADATEKQIDNAIKYAVYFKERYNSERIVRTEGAKAYDQAFHSESMADDLVVGFRSVLSSSHDVYDICDWWATADLYGLGPGTYPKWNGPDIPHHPNCILPDQYVSWVGNLTAATKSFYAGPVIKITCSNGHILAVTGNHPILTRHGWVPGNKIAKGFDVLCRSGGNRSMPTIYPHYYNAPTLVQNVFRSVKESCLVPAGRVPVSPEDLHGDAKFGNGYVDIVNANGLLWDNVFYAEALKTKYQNVFGKCGGFFRFYRDRFFSKFLDRHLSASYRVMCRLGDLLPSFFRVKERYKKVVRFFNSTDVNSFLDKYPPDTTSGDPEYVRDFLFGIASQIQFASVIKVEQLFYSGHVYNIQVEKEEIYNCNGVFVKNCKCTLESVYEGEIDPQGARLTDKRAIASINKLDSGQRKTLLGVAGSKRFAEDKHAWSGLIKSYSPPTDKKISIPLDLLHGKKQA